MRVTRITLTKYYMEAMGKPGDNNNETNAVGRRTKGTMLQRYLEVGSYSRQ